jgi:hypothetical protein
MAFDPRQASSIEAIAIGICVGRVAYLAYLLFSFFGDSIKANAIPPRLAPHRSRKVASAFLENAYD